VALTSIGVCFNQVKYKHNWRESKKL